MVLKIIGSFLVALSVVGPAAACQFPDEDNMPLRRAATRIEMLPEVEAWARAMHQSGVKPQYVVRLDERKQVAGRCYWPVEVRADGALWRRYFISPDGWKVLSE